MVNKLSFALLITNIIAICVTILTFISPSFWPVGFPYIYSGLGLGIISALAGIWIIIRNAKNRPIVLGLSLTFIGLILTVGFLFFLALSSVTI
jgi:hypothetical protein